MRLAFVDRTTYRRTLRELDDPRTLRRLTDEWGRCLVLPEGGSNAAAARGAAETVTELNGLDGPDALGARDVVCCPVGTGGTLAGIAAGLPPGARALGVAVLRGAAYLDGEVTRLHARGWGRHFRNWRIDHSHHGGGYGRIPPELATFAAAFEERHGLAVERRYVAKMLHCVYDLAGGAHLPPGTRVTAVITGPPEGGAGPTPTVGPAGWRPTPPAP
jgi:1-aminocyclopropane-1-carboxylate deaminase/D-cysteine desulfhydrase-like pyridoxal-dependent ACC family enzyme